MARPRITGWEDRELSKLVKRGLYENYGEALRAAVKLLIKDHMRKEAQQVPSLDPVLQRMQMETSDATVGRVRNKSAMAAKRR